MPIPALQPASRFETELVFEIGSTRLEQGELKALRGGNVVLLDRLSLRPDLRQSGLVTVFSESGDAFLAHADLVDGRYRAKLSSKVTIASSPPDLLRVVLGTVRMAASEPPRLSIGQHFDLCTPESGIDLVDDDGPVAHGHVVEVDGELGVRVERMCR